MEWVVHGSLAVASCAGFVLRDVAGQQHGGEAARGQEITDIHAQVENLPASLSTNALKTS